ncbi:MAG: molybdenum hydroxylase accessory protein YgfJ family [Solirubrobacterales bacterium]|nr:molybdenum hydroxylase accessory protein YgfJ family [Solirubrobacterales bacterium]
MRVVGLILAAGEGRRFGGPKQLAQLGGRPLIAHAVSAAVAVPGLERVLAVVGARADVVGAAARAAGAQVVCCPAWRAGNVASLRAGLQAAAAVEADAVVVTLADQPFVTTETIAHFAALAPGVRMAARATYGGLPGHPVLLRRVLFGEVGRQQTPQGLRRLLDAVGIQRVAADGWCRPDDVDTVADLQRLAVLTPSRS